MVWEILGGKVQFLFSRGRSGGLVFPSLSEFSTVYYDPTVKGIGIVNKAEIDAFLELSCFFHDPANVGNLIFGSLAFSKTSLNICWAISNPERWHCESAALNMPANLENSVVATGLKRSVFIPIPKKGNAKECSQLPHNCGKTVK